MKQTVHNLMEVKALIKDAFRHGDESRYQSNSWYQHDTGILLCKSYIDNFHFTLDVKPEGEQGYSLAIEVKYEQ